MGYDFNVCRPFNVHKWSEAPQVNDALNQLLDKLNPRLGGKVATQRLQYRNVLKKIVLDLYIAHLQNPKLFLAYSRRFNDYVGKRRYKSLHISFRKMIELVDALWGLGYIFNQPGFFNYSEGKGKRSLMIAQPKLIELLAKSDVAKAHVRSQRDEIVLKDSEKKLIDFAETAHIGRMRENVKVINERIAAADIRLELDDAQRRALIKKMKYLPDETESALYRVFNNGSFKQDGRFYGHWVQPVPREFRRLIQIDGNPATELDFSGLHINMLYLREGLKPPDHDDVYAISGLDSNLREILKKVLLVVLNAKDESSAARAVFRCDKNKVFRLSYREIREIIAKFCDRHEPIRRFFFSGVGIKLMYLDSCVAEEVLVGLARKGIVCLPIHDSFICAARYRTELEDAMNRAFVKKFGKTIRIHRKY